MSFNTLFLASHCYHKMKQNGKEIELKSTEKKLSKDEKYMHEVFLVFEEYVIL